MHDERNRRWEVVDGKSLRLIRTERLSKKSRITLFLLRAMMAPPRGDRIPESTDKKLQILFTELSIFALEETDYTIEIDCKLISNLGRQEEEAEKLKLLWQTAISNSVISYQKNIGAGLKWPRVHSSGGSKE